MAATTRTRTFASIVAEARRLVDLTAAEFDFSLQAGESGLGSAAHGLGEAISGAAVAGLPLVDATTPMAELVRRHELIVDLRAHFAADILAMTEAAMRKSYVGWSSASRGPIRYAS